MDMLNFAWAEKEEYFFSKDFQKQLIDKKIQQANFMLKAYEYITLMYKNISLQV